MKYFFLLMTLYVLSLSCLPCNDKDENNSSLSISTQHHAKNKTDCEPFCNCACCGLISINHSIALKSLSEVPVSYKTTKQGFINQFTPKQYLEKILQPPKIS